MPNMNANPYAKEHPVMYSLEALANIAAQTANPRTNAGGTLQTLATNYLGMQQARRKQDFIKSVSEIMGSTATSDDKINSLLKLKVQHGTDYGLGVDDIAKQYGNITKEWKPSTKEEALEFERAKVGIKSESPGEKAREKKAAFTESTKVREEFLNRPEVKEFISINTNARAIDRLVSESGEVRNRTALDQALITMFNKLTDPNSVVRESEYARTPQNLPLANRFSGALQKIQRGGAGLTDDDRRALVWGARVIANERGRTYNETYQGYVDLASQYGIETPLVTRGLKPHTEYDLNIGKGSFSQKSDMLGNLKSKYGLR